MDSRCALHKGSQLHFVNSNGGLQNFTINKEIGRGGSCIVYEAFLLSNSGDKKYYRIKECYPYKLDVKRKDDGALVPNKSCKQDYESFQEKFKNDFSLYNKIFYEETMYHYMPDQLDLYFYNNTNYIVSTFSAEKTLANYKVKDIKECICIVKKIAYVLHQIHNQQYLFLDLKPSNILIVDAFDSQIKLLDFDSLISKKIIENYNAQDSNKIRLSYSKGFAAIELEAAKIERLGAYTDVYSVGALLFWLLFGSTPTALDCEQDACINFDKVKYNTEQYNPKLFRCLSNFFRNTLSSFYFDRYQNMNDVFKELENIEKLTDLRNPFIVSTKVWGPKHVFGRDEELSLIDNFIKSKNDKCLYVTGIGGIGKSTLIRKYLSTHSDNFDVLLYMNFLGSTEKTISSDQNVCITTLNNADYKEAKVRYFDAKIKHIKQLTHDINAILVIDNFSGDIDCDTLEVLQIGCKVILISREAPKSNDFNVLNVGAISDFEHLTNILESNLGRCVTNKEKVLLPKLFNMLKCHSLSIELIAKQISSQHTTIEESLNLIENYGISGAGTESINYEKDGTTTSANIKKIINALFESDNLSAQQQNLLKIISFFCPSGININILKEIFELENFDEVNSLIRGGWVTIENNIVFMHPIIQDYVRQLEWFTIGVYYAQNMYDYFCNAIKFEFSKNNYLPSYALKNNDFSYKQYEQPFDKKKLDWLLDTSEEIINNSKFESDVTGLESYTNFKCEYLLNLPWSREEYILSSTQKLIDKKNIKSPIYIMRLYKKMLMIYLDKGQIDLAMQIIVTSKKLYKSCNLAEVRAIHFDMLTEYYDVLLNGAYDAESDSEKKLLKKLLNLLEKTIYFSKKYARQDIQHLYAESLLVKAIILIRSQKGNSKEIRMLIDDAEADILENTFAYADVRLTYFLTLAWYASLILCDIKATDCAVNNAIALAKEILPSDVDMIDGVIIPCANIYFELLCCEKSIEILQQGILICENHENIEVYERRKSELINYIKEVKSPKDNSI